MSEEHQLVAVCEEKMKGVDKLEKKVDWMEKLMIGTLATGVLTLLSICAMIIVEVTK